MKELIDTYFNLADLKCIFERFQKEDYTLPLYLIDYLKNEGINLSQDTINIMDREKIYSAFINELLDKVNSINESSNI